MCAGQHAGLLQVLIPVTIHTTGEQLQSALNEAIATYRIEPAVRLHLLSVQPPVSRHVSDFFEPGELHQVHLEAANEQLRPARELLDLAAVPFKLHVEVGRSAETIVRVAREFHCGRILMGRCAHHDLRERLFGTLAGQVRHLLGMAADCQVIGF